MPASAMDLAYRVARDLRRRHHAALEPWGISPHQARALAVIADHDEQSPRLGVVADRLRITPRAATEVADALEDLGYVARQPDPTDRRAVVLALTPAGRQAHQRFRAARDAAGAEYFASLSEDERGRLTSLLQRLVDAHEPGCDDPEGISRR